MMKIGEIVILIFAFLLFLIFLFSVFFEFKTSPTSENFQNFTITDILEWFNIKDILYFFEYKNSLIPSFLFLGIPDWIPYFGFGMNSDSVQYFKSTFSSFKSKIFFLIFFIILDSFLIFLIRHFFGVEGYVIFFSFQIFFFVFRAILFLFRLFRSGLIVGGIKNTLFISKIKQLCFFCENITASGPINSTNENDWILRSGTKIPINNYLKTTSISEFFVCFKDEMLLKKIEKLSSFYRYSRNKYTTITETIEIFNLYFTLMEKYGSKLSIKKTFRGNKVDLLIIPFSKIKEKFVGELFSKHSVDNFIINILA